MGKTVKMSFEGKSQQEIGKSMDRILIILKKENGPRASSAPALGLNHDHNIQTCLLVYAADSGERLQDHWSSGWFSHALAHCQIHNAIGLGHQFSKFDCT